MKVIAFANNRVGAVVVEILAKDAGTDLVGLVIHPPSRVQYREAILDASGLDSAVVLTAEDLCTDEGLQQLRALKADAGCSAFFGHILRPRVLELFPRGIFNLHPGYLPYNRGSYPNVWSIVESTPAGVTLHRMDEGVDTGPIVAQERVPQYATDTGETLYRRLEEGCIRLFRKTWPLVVEGNFTLTPQDPEQGTSHRRADVDRIDRIDRDQQYAGADLLDRIRARTFAGHRGCYFIDRGTKVFLELRLRKGDRETKETS